MTKTYTCDSRKKAQRWVAPGQLAWIGDGKNLENLFASVSAKITRDADDEYCWFADVEFRPATEQEFVPAKIATLKAEMAKIPYVAPGLDLDIPADTKEKWVARSAELAAEILALEALA
jgi:hypothetical protein